MQKRVTMHLGHQQTDMSFSTKKINYDKRGIGTEDIKEAVHIFI